MRKIVFLFALAATVQLASPVFMNAQTATQQDYTTTRGLITDKSGEPLIGATVTVKGTGRGVVTDLDGRYEIQADYGDILEFSYLGYKTKELKANGKEMDVIMSDDDQVLTEVVVTALGIRRDKKSLGYAFDDIKSDELMLNKNTNVINSLSGKIAGVNITQSSGAAGAGAQIILRGGTSASESRDNQPLVVVDGIIYSNSSGVVGNSSFDGMSNNATTSSNRLMDINPEDIEDISILKGPAASALYGSRAANGVILITTKKGKAGHTEVNFSTRAISSSVRSLPEYQKHFKRGYMQEQYASDGSLTGVSFVNNDVYTSWGEEINNGTPTYNNLKDFFQNGMIWDTNLSVSGGNENGNFFISGSYYDQEGIVKTTGYTKNTFRFNGEQRVGKFTFGANATYSDARTTKTLTGTGLYSSNGTGTLYSAYNWSPTDDMKHYLNDDGTRYRMFTDIDPWQERDNPYWILNKNSMKENVERFTGSLDTKWDVTKNWWLKFRMGIDTYNNGNSNIIAAGGVVKQVWQKGMISDNLSKYRYISTNFMSNWNKQLGDFYLNLMVGTSTDYTKTRRDYEMAWNFTIPDFYSYNNTDNNYTKFSHNTSKKRLVSLYGELRADWRSTLFLTVTGRNDWTSTLPKSNRSYFYPSVSGSLVFTELMGDKQPDWLTFGKLRASWAEVGKDTNPYETNTYIWPIGTYIGGKTGIGNSWTRGNSYLKPEKTRSTEVGMELRLFDNRIKLDLAYYTNNSYNQILSPRGSQATGYIFCSVNAGNVYNKGMELSLSGTVIKNKKLEWESGINIAGNRGTMGNLIDGMDIMYLTDVQYGGARAASFSDGSFMAISGTRWLRDDDGNLIVDKNGFPITDDDTYEVGNREPKFTGGWNNTLRIGNNWMFNMLWEFRCGGDVFNGTKYAMTMNGVSKFSGDIRNESLTIEGVERIYDDKGEVIGTKPVSNTWSPDQYYMFNGVMMSGYNIIKNYYTGAYNYETRNWITRVNSLRLRTISVSYNLPAKLLAPAKCIKRAVVSASANNLLLFTNYDGDPEVAAAGSGVGGSTSVGFDYCGIPSTRQFAIGINITFGK